MTRPLSGGCTCGAIRYRLTSPPMFVNCCHCTECQRQTGSAFVINAVIETDRIELVSGTPVAIATPTTSGNPHDIYRCPICLIALWSDYGRRPYVRFLRVTTLDNPAALPPDAHIFTSTSQPWVRLPETTPAFTEYYDMKTQWPAESLARRRAASQ